MVIISILDMEVWNAYISGDGHLNSGQITVPAGICIIGRTMTFHRLSTVTG